MARSLGFEDVNYRASSGRLHFSFTAAFPMWLVLEMEPAESNGFLYLSGRAGGISGEKSDWHDLLSAITAMCFRLTNVATAHVIKVELSDILPGEVYSFSVLFTEQRPLTFVDLEHPDLEQIYLAMQLSVVSASAISTIWNLCGEGLGESVCLSADDVGWIQSTVQALEAEPQDVTAYVRRTPSWQYVRFIKDDMFVCRFEGDIKSVFEPTSHSIGTVLKGVRGQLVESDSLRNYVSNRSLGRIRKIVRALGHSFADVAVIPTTTHLYVLCGKHDVIGMAANGGLHEYLEEKERLLRRHQAESRRLFSSATFRWAKKVDDEQFELMILELLNREPGVQRARKSGHSREPDFGRDILAEWYRPDRSTDQKPLRMQQVVIQCKALSVPAHRGAVAGFDGDLRYHAATGYLLVALSGVTRPATDFLERISEREGFWVDWWGSVEIEERLRANLDVARRYTSLVKVIDDEFKSRRGAK